MTEDNCYNDLTKQQIDDMNANFDKLAERKNTGKPQLHYIFELGEALNEVAGVFEVGALKYPKSNWKKGFTSSELIDSALRHIEKYQNDTKDDFEAEGGRHHLAHAAWNILVCLKQSLEHYGNDDR